MPHRGEDYDLSTVQRGLAGNLAGLNLASPGTRLLEKVVPTCPTVILDSDSSAGSFPSIDLDMRHAASELAELQDYVTTGRPPESRVLATSLVVRESTGQALAERKDLAQAGDEGLEAGGQVAEFDGERQRSHRDVASAQGTDVGAE